MTAKTPDINSFASDNVSSACPEVIDAVVAANVGTADSYGDDEYTHGLESQLSEIFETDALVFPVASGTVANAMASRMSEGLAHLSGIGLAYPTQSNEVFVRVTSEVVEGLRREGVELNHEELDGSAVRFVAAWNTTSDQVDAFLSVITAVSRRIADQE
jgi:threonine aldolase|tara:strand:+ start:1331 stop:1807 length:477 start_codon:yes stop_codon:yes gene_type:complete